MVVMGFLFYKVRGIYLATAQDVKRLEGTSKSRILVSEQATQVRKMWHIVTSAPCGHVCVHVCLHVCVCVQVCLL
jgi:uncharacterized membrane protein